MSRTLRSARDNPLSPRQVPHHGPRLLARGGEHVIQRVRAEIGAPAEFLRLDDTHDETAAAAEAVRPGQIGPNGIADREDTFARNLATCRALRFRDGHLEHPPGRLAPNPPL